MVTARDRALKLMRWVEHHLADEPPNLVNALKTAAEGTRGGAAKSAEVRRPVQSKAALTDRSTASSDPACAHRSALAQVAVERRLPWQQQTHPFLGRKLALLKLGVGTGLPLARDEYVLNRGHGGDREDLFAAAILLRVEELESGARQGSIVSRPSRGEGTARTTRTIAAI